MYQNQFLILFISLSVLSSTINGSPVFEPSENVVEDNVADDAGFERANDGFPDMNDFNFEPDGLAGQNKEQENSNQSGEQIDEDGPSVQNARERPSPGDINKATAEEQESSDDEGSNEAHGNRPGGNRNKKYQDGDENSARSLDQFEPFDKETDNLDKNDGFNENGSDDQSNRPGSNSGEEQGPRGSNLPIPPPAMQIDEPIIVNGGPMVPMPLQGRPPMIGRSNNEEGEGGKYAKSMPKKPKKSQKDGALGYQNYKFLPSGIKYYKQKPGVSKTRIAQPNLASLTADHQAADSEEELEPSMREYMNQWISNFERDPSLLNALSNSVSNINYGFGDSKKR